MSKIQPPYDFKDISTTNQWANPSMLKADSALYWYWFRALFQRATSILDVTVPETWDGSSKDFMIRLLFGRGYIGILDTVDYGYLFQPCTLGAKRDVKYQPKSIMVANPWDHTLDGEYIIGENCGVIRLTPDWGGILDIISFYAVRLANIAVSINTSIINMKQPHIYAARNKSGAESLKHLEDKVARGETLIVLDRVLYTDPNTKEDAVFDISPDSLKNNYITDMLISDEESIIREFDTEIGIPTISEKKERMVTSEAETKVVDSTTRSIVWLDCLNSSLEETKKVFPDLDLSFKLRYEADNVTENQGGIDNEVHDNPTGD